MADERLVHTDPVHDLVGVLCKMLFDIIEKDFVTITWFHELFSGIYLVEHDCGSTAISFVLTHLIVSVYRLIRLDPYYLPVMPHFLDDSTRP